MAPTADFIGDLRSTNRTVFTMIAIAIAIQLVLIYLLSRYIGRQIGRISELFNAARRLSFVSGNIERSFINELADLQGGFALLQNALSSFAKFVPTDVVTQFIESGKPVAPGVQLRAAGDFVAAESVYREMLEAFPDDRVTQLLLNELEIRAVAGNADSLS